MKIMATIILYKKELLPQYKKTMETVLGREITEDEFEKLWNKQIDAFKGKTDFSHQYITMATHLYGKSRSCRFAWRT